MFRKIVDFCAKNGFLKITDFTNTKKLQLEVGLAGSLLEENLKREWLDNFLNSKEVAVFYSNGDFKHNFIYARKLMNNSLPFGIADIIPFSNKATTSDTSSETTQISNDFSEYFTNDSKLLCTLFMTPSMGTQFFHQIQRQRKIWWRKISASPGRYLLSDIQNGSVSLDSPKSLVNINGSYQWGYQTLESINLYTNKYPGISHTDLLVKEGKKEVPLVYIQCETTLSNLFLNALCDAYEEPLFQGENRPLLRFHRKIAPFKISFCLPSGLSAESLNELQDLALYLTKLLRNNYITTLLLPSNARKTLEAQFKQYDELGIPFIVYMNEATLKDGIAWLRSRDSTLKEQVHVAELVGYVEKIYKNF